MTDNKDRCTCGSGLCTELATTTDDCGNRVCAECVDYALDADGQPHCAHCESSVVEDRGEWTGGGMHGTATGWVMRMVYTGDDDSVEVRS